LEEVVGEDLHVKTILSLANATLGVLHAASLCIHVIGRAYGWATDGDGKHGVKQVDRLLSNEKVSPWALARSWIAMLVNRSSLIDEYRFLVHPRIAGHGPTLYQSGLPSTRRLELVSAKPLRSGAVAMHYRRAR
jgi:hypothetical protein